jgi:hypothetical protein
MATTIDCKVNRLPYQVVFHGDRPFEVFVLRRVGGNVLRRRIWDASEETIGATAYAAITAARIVHRGQC